jgi:hypothetical protein
MGTTRKYEVYTKMEVLFLFWPPENIYKKLVSQYGTFKST